MKKLLQLVILFLLLVIKANSQTPEWFTDISDSVGFKDLNSSRVFCVDVNGDNYPDYLTTGTQAIRNTLKLYINQPDPNNPNKRIFIDFTEESGINVNSDSKKPFRYSDVAGFADFDNDGDMDLMTSTYTHRVASFADSNGIEQGCYSEVLLNDGSGHFTLVKNSGMHDIIAYQGKVVLPIGDKNVTFDYPPYFLNATGISFLDYDYDGNIDAYISTWFTNYYPNTEYELKMKDVLLKGNGDGTFKQVFDPAINSVQEPMYGVNVTDYNNDGWADIVTSPYCRSAGSLFKNMKNGKFSNSFKETHYSAQAMAGDHGQALCQWEAIPGDFDNDGDMDLLQVSVHGGYDEGEGRTHISINNGLDSNYSYSWNLDLLKRNVPKSLTHVGDMGGEWVDFDGNGFLDVIICQMGYESNDINTSGQTRTYMLMQNENHSFDEVTDKLGMMTSANRSHSIEPVDFDLDGDQDLMLTREFRPEGSAAVVKTTLWRNNNIPDAFWSSVKVLPSTGTNKAGIGSRITIFAGGMAQIRDVQSGLGHFGGMQPLIQNFGLGKNYAIDSIKVRFPNKELNTVTIKNPPANVILEVGEEKIENIIFADDKKHAVIGFDKSKLDFELVSNGKTKKMTFNLINYGNAELDVTSISLVGDSKKVYTLSENSPFKLAPNNSKQFEVIFSPNERTKFISEIKFESNAYNAKTGLFKLEGECFKEEPMISADADTIKLGTVLNDDSKIVKVELLNSGELDLIISGATINSTDSKFFKVLTDCSNIVLKSGEKKEIEMSFTPNVNIDRVVSGSMNILSNAYNSNNFSIPFSGRAEIRKAFAEVVSEEGVLSFPDTEVGCTCEEPLLINSVGTKALEITAYEVKFDKAGIFTIKDYKPPYIVEPGKSIELPFVFTPNAEKEWTRSLTITTNDYIRPEITLSIQGKGVKGNFIKQNVLNANIRVYPIPATESITISVHFDEALMTKTEIKLFNLLGELVKTDIKEVNSTKEMSFELNLNNLQAGYYKLLVVTGGQTYEKSILISK